MSTKRPSDDIGDMPSVVLNDGRVMPMFGLGTYRARNQKCAEAVALAIKTGYRLIDTARGYNNEEFVAQGIAKSGVPREQIFIVTKVPKDVMGYEGALKSCEDSLQKLSTSYIDLLLLHWPGGNTPNQASPMHAKKRSDAWRALAELQSAGKVRSIGVSNYTIQHLEALPLPIPAVNQVEVHPYLQQRELRRFCEGKGIHVQGYTSMGRNLEPPHVLYGKREPDRDRLVVDPIVMGVSRDCKASPAQILLRWSVERGVSVIPKAVTPSHILENYQALAKIRPLDDASLEKLDNLERALKYAWDPEGIK